MKIIWYENRDASYGKKDGHGMDALDASDPDNGPRLMSVDASKFTDDQLHKIADALGWEVESIDRYNTNG